MSSPRVSDVSVIVPFVYGSMAVHLGRKAEEFSTHRWTLYIRGPQDEDLSVFVDRVAFTLHPSFPEPVREVKEAPFEITETGWGEFEASIKIFFRDPTEQPIEFFHFIRLYPPSPQQQLPQKKPVVSELYDEIVFTDPHRQFYEQLISYGSVYVPTNEVVNEGEVNPSLKRSLSSSTLSTSTNPARKRTAFPESYVQFDDSMDIEALLAIQDHIIREIAEAKMRLIGMESQIVEAQAKKLEEHVPPEKTKKGVMADDANLLPKTSILTP